MDSPRSREADFEVDVIPPRDHIWKQRMGVGEENESERKEIEGKEEKVGDELERKWTVAWGKAAENWPESIGSSI
jgi:hypothetical protein